MGSWRTLAGVRTTSWRTSDPTRRYMDIISCGAHRGLRILMTFRAWTLLISLTPSFWHGPPPQPAASIGCCGVGDPGIYRKGLPSPAPLHGGRGELRPLAVGAPCTSRASE